MKLQASAARNNPAFLYAYLSAQIPGLDLVTPAWHHMAMAAIMERLFSGEARKVILNGPPRSNKTTICIRAGVPWILGKDPSAKIMVVTYNEDLVQELAKDVGRILRSEGYKRLFPRTRLQSDTQSFMRVTTTVNGSVFFTSFGSTMTGIGADYIIIDDPIQASRVTSAAQRDAVDGVLKYIATTRVNTPKTGRVLLLMQRLHPEDPTGKLLAVPGHDWKHVVLPARFSEPVQFDLGEFFAPYHTKPNELLDPMRLGEAELASAKATLGDVDFTAQYLQAPYYAESQYQVVERLEEVSLQDWIDRLGPPVIYHSWDTAYSTNATADYTALTKWAVFDGYAVLTEAQHFRAPTDQVQNKIIMHMNTDQAAFVIIEEAPHSQSMIADIKKSGGLPASVIGAKTGGQSKEIRLQQVLHHINSGRVKLSKGGPGIPLLLQELREFPNGRYDDLVDSFSMALKNMRFTPRKPAWRIR